MAPIRNILVADKNPHVRRLISRELMDAGFLARPASSCREVMQLAGPGQWADLLVIDPELPDCRPWDLLDHIAAVRPEMIVIIHAFGEPATARKASSSTCRFIEKAGNSIPRLVQLVQSLHTQRTSAPSPRA